MNQPNLPDSSQVHIEGDNPTEVSIDFLKTQLASVLGNTTLSISIAPIENRLTSQINFAKEVGLLRVSGYYNSNNSEQIQTNLLRISNSQRLALEILNAKRKKIADRLKVILDIIYREEDPHFKLRFTKEQFLKLLQSVRGFSEKMISPAEIDYIFDSPEVTYYDIENIRENKVPFYVVIYYKTYTNEQAAAREISITESLNKIGLNTLSRLTTHAVDSRDKVYIFSVLERNIKLLSIDNNLFNTNNGENESVFTVLLRDIALLHRNFVYENLSLNDFGYKEIIVNGKKKIVIHLNINKIITKSETSDFMSMVYQEIQKLCVLIIKRIKEIRKFRGNEFISSEDIQQALHTIVEFRKIIEEMDIFDKEHLKLKEESFDYLNMIIEELQQ